MRKSKKLLASVLIVALLATSAVHALADENASVPTTEDQVTSGDGLDDWGSESEGSDVGLDDTEGSLCDFDEFYDCCTSDDEGSLDLENADVNEIDIDDEELEDYERMEMLFIANSVLHTPDEQLIAVFFQEEEMVLTDATLHTRSLTTGEEFFHPYYMMIENAVSFVIEHQAGSGEDEIKLVSIEYTFEGYEDPITLEFYDHNIETTYIVTNEPLPGSEESGIVVHGIGDDGEIISEETDIDNISEAIEEIIDALDEYGSTDETLDIEGFLGIAPTSGGVTQINPTTGATTSNNRIIVVSAGHCSTHAGASANGLVEHELNWHVAGVVVNELNTFAGITAIRDRPTIHCRWPGGGWQRCVTERVHQARRDGASIFVDIHFNASTNAAAHGAEIWIPNTSVNDGMHQAGRLLSDEILRRLGVLGMHNRGHRTVPNGQLEFASNRIARELGMLGILVEGGFLTNTADANRLRDPNFRHRLGVEIARGIATVDIGNIGAPPAPIVSTTTAQDTNGRETLFNIRTRFSSGGARVARVRFGVWSEHNGQNDVAWHNGVRQADGSWTARADARNHRYPGRHRINTWVTTTAGEQILSSRGEFYVRAATGGTAQIFNSNPSGGTFDARLRGFSTPSGVSGVRVAVWTRANRSDIRWTTATRLSCGFLGMRIQTEHHGFHVGTYHVRFRITTGNGQVVYRDTTHLVTQRPVVTVSATNRDREILYNLSVSNARLMGEFRTVRFGVWSEHNGQNDVVWYNATLNNGVWRGIADVRRHRYAGTFRVNAWGVRANNERVLLGRATFYVSRPTTGRVEVLNSSPSGGTFDARLRGFSTPSGVSGIRVAVWTRADRSDIRWTTATRQSCGFLGARINASHHNFHSGTYHVRFRITTGNGQLIVRDTTHFFTPNRSPSSGLIRIMGTSQTNVAQMVRNFNNSGHTFPTTALGMNLNSFAQLVLNEANREGVRAEVLWTQIMRETGWLQFRGDVRINQFNFGGIGATGGGNPGHSFPSVQIGLRAQVHHLVAYATTAPVRNPSNRAHPIMRTSPPWGPTGQTVVNGTESPRFHFVARGISPYVNWLGQGENPNHPGFWAADRNYGAALAAAIRVLLNS